MKRLFNIDFLGAVSVTPMVGAELCFEDTDEVSICHSDSWLVLNLQKRARDANMISAINARLNDLGLSGIDISDSPVGSRFQPWLSDKLAAAQDSLSALSKAEKDKERSDALAKAQSDFEDFKKKLSLKL